MGRGGFKVALITVENKKSVHSLKFKNNYIIEKSGYIF